MKSIIAALIFCLSLTSWAQVTSENLALAHVEEFISLYGKKSLSIKKSDGAKYEKLKKKLAEFTTPEVLAQLLDDDRSKSTDLSFATAILFSTEANANHVKKELEQSYSYEVLGREETVTESKFILALKGESKLDYEVVCRDQEKAGLFGLKSKVYGCTITKVTPKNY